MIDQELTGNRGVDVTAPDTSPDATLALARTHGCAPRAITSSGLAWDAHVGTTIPDQPS